MRARSIGDVTGRANAHLRHELIRSVSVSQLDLDQVIAALNQHQQRATYSAVAGLLDESPRLLMRSRRREQANSWIVSKATGRPTGYDDADLHPQLLANASVIETRDELASWLSSRGCTM
jgi:hypothetical protein